MLFCGLAALLPVAAVPPIHTGWYSPSETGELTVRGGVSMRGVVSTEVVCVCVGGGAFITRHAQVAHEGEYVNMSSMCKCHASSEVTHIGLYSPQHAMLLLPLQKNSGCCRHLSVTKHVQCVMPSTCMTLSCAFFLDCMQCRRHLLLMSCQSGPQS